MTIDSITTKEEFSQRTQDKTRITVVEYYAQWCSSCKRFANEYEKLSTELDREFPNQLSFTKVDIDQVAGQIEEVSSISHVPTFHIYYAGKVLQTVNVPLPEKLRQAVMDAMSQKSSVASVQHAKIVPLTETTSFSIGQPTADQLKNLHLIGVKSVVNLRPADEDGVLPEEEQLVNEHGVKYVALPVRLVDMNRDYMERFVEQVKQLPSPVMVHCKTGLRAFLAALLMELKDTPGATVADLLETASQFGWNNTIINNAQLYTFVTDYLTRPKT